MTPRLPVLVSAAALTVVALTACGVMPVPTLSPTPTGSGSATPTAIAPTPSSSPTATVDPTDPNLLFTISVTLTSPVGALAHVTQAVYKQVPTIANQAAVEQQLDEQCDGWRNTVGPADYVRTVITSDDVSTGGKVWSPSGHFVVTLAGFPAWFGDYTSFMAYCASVQGLIPGTIEGIAPVPAGAVADARGGWATLQYGFGIATDPQDQATDPQYTQLSDCVITLSPYAAANSAIAPTWAGVVQDPGLCEVNRNGT